MQRERIPITQEGLEKLREEYDDLVNRRRPEVVRAIQQAREEGDLRENAGYDAAKHDQGFIEARIREIEQLLRRVDVIEQTQTAGKDGSIVRLGSTVTVEIDGIEETYTIVGQVEAKPREGRISNESPVGQALLGHRVGQTVSIRAPGGATMSARIMSVQS
jgi:transcription elongation factor GreA